MEINQQEYELIQDMLEEADMERQTLKGIWEQIKFGEKWNDKFRDKVAQTYEQFTEIRKAGFASKGLSNVWIGTWYHELMEERLKAQVTEKPLFTIFCTPKTLPVFQQLINNLEKEINENATDQSQSKSE